MVVPAKKIVVPAKKVVVPAKNIVVPAKAGIQLDFFPNGAPAYAGATAKFLLDRIPERERGRSAQHLARRDPGVERQEREAGERPGDP